MNNNNLLSPSHSEPRQAKLYRDLRSNDKERERGRDGVFKTPSKSSSSLTDSNIYERAFLAAAKHTLLYRRSVNKSYKMMIEVTIMNQLRAGLAL